MRIPKSVELTNQQLPGHDNGLASGLSRPIMTCLLLALITLALFSDVGSCDFINYDDPEYVTANPHVQGGLTSKNVAWAFGLGYAANWHPLTWLSHMLDVDLFGTSPAGPHVVNLIFHIINGLLLFLLLRDLTDTHWRSAFVAALFLLHPLHVESVAWISERKDVLSTMFGLLSLWAYGRYTRQAPLSARWRAYYYGIALLLFALGLMAKPMLVTMPFLLLLIDYWPLGRFSQTDKANTQSLRQGIVRLGGLIVEKIPFFTLAGVSCALTLMAQTRGFVSTANLPMWARINNAFVSYARYLGKTFWPENLSLPYPYCGLWPTEGVILAAALVIGISATAFLWKRLHPFFFTGWFWFLGTLVPVIGLVQVGSQSMADRYTYVPLIGIFIVFSWGMMAAAEWRSRLRPAVCVTVTLILIVCPILTWHQLGYWRSSETLFRHALCVTRNNSIATINLAGYLLAHGNVREAFEQYLNATRINPGDASALEGLGLCYLARNDPEAAIAIFNRALQINPDAAYIRKSLGDAFLKANKHVQAIACYKIVLQSMPDDSDTLKSLGDAFFEIGEFEQAVTCYQHIVQLRPDDPNPHFDLGSTFYHMKNTDKALQQYAEAVRLAPDEALAHFMFGNLLAETGHRDEAITQLMEALRLDPSQTKVKQALEALKATATE